MDVICGTKETAEWVKALHFDTLQEIRLEVITDKFVRCYIKILTRRTPYSIEEFKPQLMEGNPGLVVKNLTFLGSKAFSPSESLIFFGIDKDAFEMLRKMSFRIYFDCMYTEVRSEVNRGENQRKKLKIMHVK